MFSPKHRVNPAAPSVSLPGRPEPTRVVPNSRARSRTVRGVAALAPLAVAIALAACGGSDDSGGGSSDGPTVAATTGVVADLAQDVAGDDAEVVQVIPDNASPHDFQLSARDRQELEDATLMVASGAGLEAGLPLDDLDVPSWELTDHAGELRGLAAEDEHGEAHEDEHAGDDKHADKETADEDHGDEEAADEDSADEDDGGETGGDADHADEDDEHAGEDDDEGAEDHAGDEEGDAHEHEGDLDPHVWMDPSRVAHAAPSLAGALAEADPENAEAYRARADELADRLRSLDRELAETLDTIPKRNRKLLTSHDALGYLADRYGLELLPTPFPTSGPEASPSAQGIREVEDAIGDSGVPAVFAQQTDDPEVLEQIADRTGVEVVTGLLVEAPGPAGSYLEMLREDADLIASGLGGSPG